MMSYTLLRTSRRILDARETEQFASSVMQQRLELNLLTHAYLKSYSGPERIPWETKYQTKSGNSRRYWIR
jgi:hypothetical protein